MSRLFSPLILTAFLAGVPLCAQYGGGPLGGGSIPVPWHHKKSSKSTADPTTPPFSADGKTVSNDGKKLIVATADGRTLTLKLDEKTKFTRSGRTLTSADIVPRTTVHIEALEDDEAYLTATQVELVKDAPAEEARSARPENVPDQTPGARPTILDNPVDVPERPVLRRGIPKETEKNSDTNPTETSSTEKSRVQSRDGSANKAADDSAASSKASQTAAADTRSDASTDFTIGSDDERARTKRTASASEALIARTKEWSETFTNGLPNFVCQQSTTRYMEQSKATGWEAQDIVTAKVVFEDGKEDYREITVGGKKTNKSMLELGGSSSTGEFASTLRSLFSDASQAQFTFYRSSTVGHTPAAIYDFKVALPHSDWFVNIGGQSLRPAYSGSVWIDRSTAEVRRIEMQADNIAESFPLDSVQWAVDYDTVRLGTATFLLPVHAENLSCQRGSPICMKNAIDFRDYHKYSGESTITFDK